MTREGAIKKANEMFGCIHRVGGGPEGWGFLSYDKTRKAWWQPGCTHSYQQAKRIRSGCVAEEAVKLLLPDEDKTFIEMHVEHQAALLRGDVASKVRRLLHLIDRATV